MCGRYTLTDVSPELIKRIFLLQNLPDLRPRYNIAPTQDVLVIRETAAGERTADFLRWGLVPSWARDETIGNRMINLRSETVYEKHGFRGSLRSRRCLVVADGFYEWQKVGDRKQPVWIRREDGAPFGLGGIWDHWTAPDSTTLESCSIITTEPSEFMAPYHDRMPLIVPEQDYSVWLDTEVRDHLQLTDMLRPYTRPDLSAVLVTTRVNNPSNDDAGCIEPQTAP